VSNFINSSYFETSEVVFDFLNRTERSNTLISPKNIPLNEKSRVNRILGVISKSKFPQI